ncbi:MAG: SDR family oxidoreductase, partial [Ktedonobacterales bacterium]
MSAMRIDAGLARTARPTVLVAGATGYLGRQIVAALRRADYPVRALARDPHRLGFAPDDGIEVFGGQVTRPETLAGLCNGVSIVVSTLGVRSLKRRPTPWEVDYQGNLNVLTLAEKAGVQRFIFAGVLHGEQLRRSIAVLEPRERFIDTLQSSGIPWTVLRPTGFFNDMEIIFKQARRGRVIQVGDGATRMNPLHPDDLADAVIRSIENPAARDTTTEVGGPDRLPRAGQAAPHAAHRSGAGGWRQRDGQAVQSDSGGLPALLPRGHDDGHGRAAHRPHPSRGLLRAVGERTRRG